MPPMPQRSTPVAPTSAPNKWFGLPKWAVIVIAILGVVLAYYLYKRQQANAAATASTNPTDASGQTSATLGGTPADNSLQTLDNEALISQQLAQMELSLSELQQQETATTAAGTYPPGGGTSTPGGSITGTIPTTNPIVASQVPVTMPVSLGGTGTSMPLVQQTPTYQVGGVKIPVGQHGPQL